jgi:hypothetical protein
MMFCMVDVAKMTASSLGREIHVNEHNLMNSCGCLLYTVTDGELGTDGSMASGCDAKEDTLLH